MAVSIRQQFLTVDNEECQSIDEIMVPFKGRSTVRQYMPAKPHKMGFKSWGRAGASGIVHDFNVYPYMPTFENQKSVQIMLFKKKKRNNRNSPIQYYRQICTGRGTPALK